MFQEKAEQILWYERLKDLLFQAYTASDSAVRDKLLSEYEDIVRRIDMTLVQCGSHLRIIGAPPPSYLVESQAEINLRKATT